MKNRKSRWLPVVFLVFCIPWLVGAFCEKKSSENKDYRNSASAEETAEKIKEEAPPVYPGAALDMSDEAIMKANSVNGQMYLTTDSWDKVTAYYEKELAGKPEYAKHGASRYTYKDSLGNTCEVWLMPAGEDGASTNILIGSMPPA